MSLVPQTTYAELLEQAQSRAFAKAFPERGAFVAKTVRGNRYWYFQTGRGKERVQRYAGPESQELLERIRQHREVRDDERDGRVLVSTLVRSFGLPRALPQTGAVVAALAHAGVFRLRGVLVGTVAFQTYPAMLGQRIASSALQTGDVDIAQFKEISVAVGESTPPPLEVLQQVDPTFRPIPHSSESRRSVSYGARGGLRVDFLTPNAGPDTDKPQRLPALQTDAQPLRFLDYLIHQSVPAVLLHDAGVLVRVPAPERFAIHKLIVAQRRHAGAAKSGKDLSQAQALLEILGRERPHDLAQAWNDAYERGKAWRQLVCDGARRIAPPARDGLLKAIGWTRERLGELRLSFPSPAPRYDFDLESLVFVGKDGGGEMRCVVSGEALRDHFGVERRKPGDFITAFEERPSLFEAMANEKYLSSAIEEPGSVVLRTGDIAQLRARAAKPGP